MKNILEVLAEKEEQYRPIPFWSWNSQLDINELIRQIKWMKENAIGGFFMHARSGLKTPYLSDEWMQCIMSCCDQAKESNMRAWAYDENGWPSGFVGGKLLKQESDRDMYITYTTGTFDASADLNYFVDGKYIERVNKNKGEGQYLNLKLHLSASTVDILNPDVTRRFLEMTHQKYVDYMGDEFSEKLEGFFTDEPQYYRWNTPYTPLIREYFKEEYGVELFNELGLLFVEKEGYRTFRYRYWLGMQNLMLRNYAKQVYEWCDKNNVKLTGHYLEEQSLDWQMMCCGGIMPFYEYEHIPGVDWLGAETNNELPAKQVSSVAKQLGKKQVITETFGCCGWDVTPADLRRIAGFQMANGVNLVCHHLIPYTEQGQRKRDYPPHFSQINPWIQEHFKEFNLFLSRVGCLLAEGKEEVKVAVFHPIRSSYFDYKREKPEEGFCVRELDNSLRDTVRMLSSRAISYHFLDETLMEKYGYVEDAYIGCGACKYEYLVIPKVITMGKGMEKLLRKYIQNGGRVLLLDEVPRYLEGERFEYDYLKSTCTLKDILNVQPFTVSNEKAELYYAYRMIDNQPFLYVQNTSDNEEQVQQFEFPEHVHSFKTLDPITLQWGEMGLSVKIPANGSLLLFPVEECIVQEEHAKPFVLRFQDAKVEFETNYMPVDVVCYSKDGKSYSDEIVTYQLFQKLLEERYEGDLWVRYYFEVSDVPEDIKIIAEKGNATDYYLNGERIVFNNKCTDDVAFWTAEISDYVKQGKNYYEVKMPWHQSEETYYALFGVNVAGSLKNCVVYESEIETIYLAGKFGVYSTVEPEEVDEQTIYGSSFYIGKAPRLISEPTINGFPFMKGHLTMTQRVVIPPECTYLEVDGRYQTAKVSINGIEIGDLCFGRRIELQDEVRGTESMISVRFCLSNRNLFGPFRYVGKEIFVGPAVFSANDFGDNGKDKYKLLRFYQK